MVIFSSNRREEDQDLIEDKNHDKDNDIIHFETINNVTNEANISMNNNDNGIALVIGSGVIDSKKDDRMINKTKASSQIITFCSPSQTKFHVPSILIMYSLTLKAKTKMMKYRY